MTFFVIKILVVFFFIYTLDILYEFISCEFFYFKLF